MIVWGIASLLAAISWSVGALMFFRFLIGVGVGGEAPVAQAMVSEFVPANARCKYIAIMEGFWAVGFVLSGSISYFLLPYLGWRHVFVAVGLLSAVVFLVRRNIPESPRWLADKGRFGEADTFLQTWRARSKSVPASLYPRLRASWLRPTKIRGRRCSQRPSQAIDAPGVGAVGMMSNSNLRPSAHGASIPGMVAPRGVPSAIPMPGEAELRALLAACRT